MIPWYVGGQTDPWNHCEAVIALSLANYLDEAAAGLNWVFSRQNVDGSLGQYFMGSGLGEPRRDLNCTLYPSVALLVYYLVSGDDELLRHHFGAISRAFRYVIGFQRPGGEFPWAVDPDGRAHEGALLAASSSMVTSMQAGLILAGIVGGEIVGLSDTLDALKNVISSNDGVFLDKSSWAMDSYYPVLSGALEPKQAMSLVQRCTLSHFEPNWGVRCISKESWVTTAETAEFAIALSLCSMVTRAEELVSLLERFRLEDGSYFTGIETRTNRSFPGGERSSYSASAVVLAEFVLSSGARGGLINALMSLGSVDGELAGLA